jgi:LssY C-terminus
MLQYLVRFAKRFAVLVPGLAIAAVAIFNIYPQIDKGTSPVVAFLITYILAAYVLIPAATRLVRIFVKPRHLPVYSVTPDGYASDPINIGIIGTRDEMVYAMRRAGWEVADDHNLANVWREAVCTILRVPYPNAPMSSLYLFGRKQDIAFEIQIGGRLWHRHHVRFWATTYDKGTIEANSIHWFPRKERQLRKNDRLLWLGAPSKDVGLALIKHNAQLTHMIHPDTNAERELIVDHLQIEGAKLVADLEIMKPYTLVNRAWSGYLQTDGHLKIIEVPRLQKL